MFNLGNAPSNFARATLVIYAAISLSACALSQEKSGERRSAQVDLPAASAPLLNRAQPPAVVPRQVTGDASRRHVARQAYRSALAPVVPVLHPRQLRLGINAVVARNAPAPAANANPNAPAASAKPTAYPRQTLFESEAPANFAGPGRAAQQSDTRAYLTLQVNGTEKAEVLALIRNGDVLISLQDLQAAGLHDVPVQSQSVDGTPYVSLQSLAPAIGYVLDARALVLGLRVPTQYLGETVLDLHAGLDKRYPPSSNASAFFNYAFNLSGFKTLTEFSEVALSSHGNLYYSGFSIEPSGKIIRGLSNITFDNPTLMKRWVIGDAFSDPGFLGGATFLAGVSVSRNFNLNPYFVRYPGVGVSGAVLTPSTASVYVNGQLVGIQQLPPGKFDIRNIPVVSGSGNTQVVIRDAFGHTQSLSSPYYFSTALLGRGLSEYSYGLGARRLDGEHAAPHYGPVVFSGHDNVGITDWFTAGARLEAGAGLVSAGPSAAWRFGSGQIGLSAGASQVGGLGGTAGQLNYSYQNRRWSAGGSYTALSDHYANLSLLPSDDRASREFNFAAGAALGPRTSLSFNYSTATRRDAGPVQQASLAGAVQFSDRVNLIVTASRQRLAGTPSNQFFLALNYRLGANTLASMTTQAGAGGGGTGFSLQKSLQAGNGVGYLLSQGTGSQVHANDIIQYQTPTGLYGASFFQDGSEAAPLQLSATGGVVSAGDGLLFTRVVEDGFGIIDLPGLRNVRGYLNNQEVGRTDGKGRLFVPNLLSYYDNRVEISDQDIPLEYSIQSTEEIAVPSYRGGALVRFPVQRMNAVTGTLLVDGKRSKVVPAYGRLEVSEGAATVASDIGSQGEFYLEDIVPGEYPARVQYADGVCNFTLHVPQLSGAVTRLGALQCGLPQISGTTH